MAKYDAVVLAGSEARPRAKEYTQELLTAERVPHKGLIVVNNHPMLEIVVGALLDSDHIEHIYVVGMRSGVERTGVSRHPDVTFDPGGDTYTESVLRGCALTHTELALFTAGDLPLLSRALVDEFIQKCEQRGDGDLYCALTPLRVAQSQLPSSLYAQRNYYRYSRSDRMSNTDLFLARCSVLHDLQDYLEKGRSPLRGKSTVALMMTILKWRGLGLLWKYLWHRLDLDDIEVAFQRMTGGHRLRLIVLDTAGANFDIDRVWHLEAVREYLSSSSSSSSSVAEDRGRGRR